MQIEFNAFHYIEISYSTSLMLCNVCALTLLYCNIAAKFLLAFCCTNGIISLQYIQQVFFGNILDMCLF